MRVLVLLGVAATVALVVVDSSPARPRPALRLSERSPLLLRGTHFRPTETVTVRVRLDRATYRRIVRTTRTGAFSVAIETPLPYDPCTTSFVALAAGSAGDSAALKLPLRACPPA